MKENYQSQQEEEDEEDQYRAFYPLKEGVLLAVMDFPLISGEQQSLVCSVFSAVISCSVLIFSGHLAPLFRLNRTDFPTFVFHTGAQVGAEVAHTAVTLTPLLPGAITGGQGGC